MRVRPILTVALAMTALVAPYAGAAPKPQIEDPAGDQRGSGDYDIVSVGFDVTKKAGKLKDLVVTFTLGSAPTMGSLPSYNLRGDVAGCGTFLLYSYTRAAGGMAPDHNLVFSGCGSETDPATGDPEQALTPTAEIKGNAIIYTVKFAEMPKEIQKATFDAMTAWTAPAEPVVGYTVADFVDEGAFDSAASTSSFKVGG
ncbi:MAG TPA: hypothetical protein VNA12_00265 [Mycobacteriales bacterium]|nr:hypothetical protein [Mycobacteriales bacterium]